MDFATLLGIIAGSVLIVTAVAGGGSIMAFVNVPSMLIVVGGTLAAAFINYPMSKILGLIGIVKKPLLYRLPSPTRRSRAW